MSVPNVAKDTTAWVSRIVASVTAFEVALFQLLGVFGVEVDPGVQAGLIAFTSTTIGIVGPWVAGRFIHERVTPWSPTTGASSPVGVLPVDGSDAAAG